jgi:manganese/zinc/iron transport system substrate-binding protein
MAAPNALGAAASQPRAVSAVVATTSMIADLARVLGGEAVEVTGLMGPGVDPHSYRATRSDIAAMTRADLVLWHGLNLEVQLKEFMERLTARTRVLPVADALRGDARLQADPEYPGQFDPHVWMDPMLWDLVAEEAALALAGVLPEQATAISDRRVAFAEELRALDAYARMALDTIPPERRVLVTAHDAFGYFGAAYGIEVMGIQGISTNSEAGLARIADLVDMLVTRRISAVFVESSISPRNVRALVEGAAARGHEVRIGGELYSDAMGPAGAYEGTYLGMMDHNITLIAAALGGEAPRGGRLGRLAAA